MAIDITISHPSLNGPHEALGFTGSTEQLTALGIEYLQTVGGGVESRRYQRGLQVISKGDVFVRAVALESDEGDTLTASDESASWTWFGPAAALRGAVRWSARPPIVRAAGSPMVTPVGHPIFLGDGTRPVQPASGEPARDPWTGEPTGETQP